MADLVTSLTAVTIPSAVVLCSFFLAIAATGTMAARKLPMETMICLAIIVAIICNHC